MRTDHMLGLKNDTNMEKNFNIEDNLIQVPMKAFLFQILLICNVRPLTEDCP